MADCNEIFLGQMAEVVDKDEELCLMGAVRDGGDMYKLIRNKEPDVAVVDLVMTGMDGFSLLERVHKDPEIKRKPRFILTSNINNERIIQDTFCLGADYFLLKPFNAAILPKRIKQVAKESGIGHGEMEAAVSMVETAPMRQEQKEKEALSREELQLIISDYLCRMGVPAHIKGYRYLATAIEICVRDIAQVECITKVLYPEIARMYASTSSRVERAIRHAIEVAWGRGQIQEQNEMFGYTINLQKGRPTNSEFIAMLASRIRLQYKVK